MREPLTIVHTHASLRAGPQPWPGAEDTVRRLRSGGLAVVLSSNTLTCPGTVVRRILDYLSGLSGLFDHLFVFDELGVAKPHPRFFQTVAQAVQADPGQILHVGDDRRTDVRGALAAGWQAVWLDRTGSRHPHSAGPTPVVQIADLPDLLTLLPHHPTSTTPPAPRRDTADHRPARHPTGGHARRAAAGGPAANTTTAAVPTDPPRPAATTRQPAAGDRHRPAATARTVRGGTAAVRLGRTISLEGVWGAGKTTVAGLLADELTRQGFDTRVLHYGPRSGVIAALSDFLEREPLRGRHGAGGYAQPHHPSIDVLLRLCREAAHQRCYHAAAQAHDVVIIDHGMYGKLAYCLTVLAEQYPLTPAPALLERLHACTRLWWLRPDLAVHLDVPWPLARERAIARGRGGGNPAATERLLFLPGLDDSYRQVLAAHHERVRRIAVGFRSSAEVAAETAEHAYRLLRVPTREGTADE